MRLEVTALIAKRTSDAVCWLRSFSWRRRESGR